MSRRAALTLIAMALLGLAACARTAAKPATSRWTVFAKVRGPVDLAGPRSDGTLILAAAGRLRVLKGNGATRAIAAGYRGGGGEPYIALAATAHKGCNFGSAIYALKLGSPHGVVAVAPSGSTRTVATLAAPGLEDGIAFDETGAFGHRLLVTVTAASRTTVYAISCRGTASVITSGAPRVEGGIAVAPPGFGRFAGDLIAPDELTGRIYAIAANGTSTLVASSDLPHGQDVGVESEVFVPGRPGFKLLLSDRRTPGNRHPGDDEILALSNARLAAAGVKAGDLLLATEGGAKVDDVRCAAGGCTVRHVADGPAIAHAEGHIAVLPG